jgi:hypothetical protein
MKKDFLEKIYLTITGENNSDWQAKLREISERKIDSAAVFLERFEKKEREFLRRSLLESTIKYVPLVHLRNDTGIDELEFFLTHFNTRHFNIHENAFDFLDQWNGHLDKLYLEMNYDNVIPRNVVIEKIGGFCVDLAHLKSAFDRKVIDANFVLERKSTAKFACNHLNGYSPAEKWDLHFVTNLNDFDYLTTLPKFVFGDIIALELDNPIEDQIKFRDHVAGVLNDYFNGQEIG